jgi:hypothetical protein
MRARAALLGRGAALGRQYAVILDLVAAFILGGVFSLVLAHGVLHLLSLRAQKLRGPLTAIVVRREADQRVTVSVTLGSPNDAHALLAEALGRTSPP